MPDNRVLNIVDETGAVIDTATRERIHSEGLLHREVHVWLYNPRTRELFFQLRAKDKDTFPGLLDASIGGHVEIGDSYEKTALKEAEEETGLHIEPKKLKYVTTIRHTAHDDITRRINNVIRKIFCYKFEGMVTDLKIEKGKAIGFEAVKIDSLFAMPEVEKKRFIPSIFDNTNLDIYRIIERIR